MGDIQNCDSRVSAYEYVLHRGSLTAVRARHATGYPQWREGCLAVFVNNRRHQVCHVTFEEYKNTRMRTPPEKMADTVESSGTANGEEDHIREVFCIPVNMTYVTSITGILTAAEMVVSLIGLIIVAATDQPGCVYLYGSTYSYYEFVTVTWMILCMVRYLMFCLTLYRRLCFNIVPWMIVELIMCLLFGIMFLIAGATIAAHVCFQSGYRAGAAFAFIGLILIIGDIIVMFIRIRREYPPTTNPVLKAMGVPAKSQESSSAANAEWDLKY
ncbi:hypothetical protein ScPMuIL_001281 [Solemya velum]